MTTKRPIQNAMALPDWSRQFMLLLIALMCLLIPLHYAHADEPQSAGKVIFVFGKAWKLANDGGKYDVKRGMEVKVGEVIETSSTGQVQIRMNDNGLISIRPSSQFKIKAFKFSGLNGADRSDDKTYFQLLKGGFRSITGAVGEHNKKAYKVLTPVATIGIRGTDYSARLCDGNCSRADGLYIGVWRGGVSMTNNAGVLNVDAGSFGYVPDMSSPGQAVDNIPAGMLLASSGVRAEDSSAPGATPVTTLAELASNDVALIDPSVLSLPSTGIANYNLSSISGTDSNGLSVVGGSATLNADFGNQIVDANLSLNMSDSTSGWTASATGMSLQSNGGFAGAMTSVTGTDSGGTTLISPSGSVSGSLTGLGNGTVPSGASLSFDMTGQTLSSGSVSVSGQASTTP